MNARMWSACFGVAMLTTSCTRSPQSAAGFHLPEGDLDRGKAAFVELGCNACHRIADTESSPIGLNPEQVVELGGEILWVKTYGQLVSSIIDPSHEIATKYRETGMDAEGESLMHCFNDVMTVQQLVDLVTYLESRYTLLQPDYQNPVMPGY